MNLLSGFLLLSVFLWPGFCPAATQGGDDAFLRYSEAYEQFKSEASRDKKNVRQGARAAAVNLTGSWSSNTQYVAEVKVIDDEGVLRGIVRVPNNGAYDTYHFSGFVYDGSIYLGHYAASGRQLFVGTLSGTTISGDLSLYDVANNYLGRLSGIVMTKDIAQGSQVASGGPQGNWRTTVLSTVATGTLASTTFAALGEDVCLLTGEAKVFFSAAPSPYHVVGYMRNNGEVFLLNSNALNVRTLLGGYADGRITGILEQDAVTTDAAAALMRQVFPVSAILLLDGQ